MRFRARDLPVGVIQLAAVALAVSCSPPPPPSLSPSAPRPEPAATASTCDPPYPMFEAGKYWLADLETGAQCTAFLERDECIVAIFRDCTTAGLPREWQGRVRSGGEMQLGALYPGPRPPGSPGCCHGPIHRPLQEDPWASLNCTSAPCLEAPTGSASGANPPLPDHLGLYLERVHSPSPLLRMSSLHALAGRGVHDVAMASLAGEPPKDRIYVATDEPAVREFELGADPRLIQSRVVPLQLGQVPRLVAGEDGLSVFVADGRTLVRLEVFGGASDPDGGISNGASVAESAELGGHIERLAMGHDAVLAVLYDPVRIGRRFVALRPGSILDAPLLDLPLEGRITGLVGSPSEALLALVLEQGDAGARLSAIGVDGATAHFSVPDDATAFARVADGSVAFIASCPRRPTRFCYHELSFHAETPELQSWAVPELDRPTALLHLPDMPFVILAAGRRAIAFDRDAGRPWLRATSELGQASASALVWSSATRRVYAVGAAAADEASADGGRPVADVLGVYEASLAEED